eukprot:m.126825 g.126825  ORF g.126825 m.126825 type:complete len:381 (+) comp19830_c0_seq1:61-1203(+)
MTDIVALRRHLHAHPELSNEEHQTAEFIAAELRKWSPSELHTHIGGTGLIAVFGSGNPGPTIMFRSELDALPIHDKIEQPYRAAGAVGHKCGHDGHMATLCALAQWLSTHPPRTGRVLLLFQPAEEIGEGAERMLKVMQSPDSAVHHLLPIDYCYAYHNYPTTELPLGGLLLRPRVLCPASVGVSLKLMGRTTHAAHPEDGRCPAPAISSLITFCATLAAQAKGFALATIVHLNMGEKAFGTCPGFAEFCVTLRADEQADLDTIKAAFAQEAARVAAGHGLSHTLSYVDEFKSTVNDEAATENVRAVAVKLGLPVKEPAVPFRWSEDFGVFTQAFKGAMFCASTGKDSSQLHNTTYDYPDELLPKALAVFTGLVELHTRT